MEEPTYHLAGVMHTRDELPADFDGPLSVILLLLSKNKIEIQDVRDDAAVILGAVFTVFFPDGD